MKTTNKLTAVLCVVMAVLLVAGTVAVIAYQRGVFAHRQTLEELDNELRQAVLQKEQLQKELGEDVDVDLSKPMSERVQAVHNKARLAASMQNQYAGRGVPTDVAEANSGDVEISTAEKVWYQGDSNGRNWTYMETIAVPPAGSGEVQLVWLLQGVNPADISAVAYGHYDEDAGYVVCDSVYSLSMDTEVVDNDPTAPEADYNTYDGEGAY